MRGVRPSEQLNVLAHENFAAFPLGGGRGTAERWMRGVRPFKQLKQRVHRSLQ